MSEPIEITLPESSIIRQIFEGVTNPEGAGEDIKEVEKTMTDEEYQEMLKGFVEYARKQAEHNKPENKLRRKIEFMKDLRNKEMLKRKKKGFLNP